MAQQTMKNIIDLHVRTSPGGDLRSPAGLGLDTVPPESPQNFRNSPDLRAGPAAISALAASPRASPRSSPRSMSPSVLFPPAESEVEISEFLQAIDMTKYLEIFEREEIDFTTLLTMGDSDLKSIGITLFGPRRKIMAGLKRYQEHALSVTRAEQIEDVQLVAKELQHSFNLRVNDEVKDLESQLLQANAEKLKLEQQLAAQKDLLAASDAKQISSSPPRLHEEAASSQKLLRPTADYSGEPDRPSDTYVGDVAAVTDQVPDPVGSHVM